MSAWSIEVACGEMRIHRHANQMNHVSHRCRTWAQRTLISKKHKSNNPAGLEITANGMPACSTSELPDGSGPDTAGAAAFAIGAVVATREAMSGARLHTPPKNK